MSPHLSFIAINFPGHVIVTLKTCPKILKLATDTKRRPNAMEEIERRVIGKVMRRLIPFLILCYFVAYLDRVNVSFAKLHMNQALGFSEAAFGLGAGPFFHCVFSL
jgi:hypothetical protein